MSSQLTNSNLFQRGRAGSTTKQLTRCIEADSPGTCEWTMWRSMLFIILKNT